MKPFNLEQAIAGKPLIARNGDKAELAYVFANGDLLIVYTKKDGAQAYSCIYSNGYCVVDSVYVEDPHDVFMAPTKVTKWINLYANCSNRNGYLAGTIYNTKEEAEKESSKAQVISIEIEE